MMLSSKLTRGAVIPHRSLLVSASLVPCSSHKHSPMANLTRLPPEVLRHILQLLVSSCSPGLPNLALQSICRAALCTLSISASIFTLVSQELLWSQVCISSNSSADRWIDSPLQLQTNLRTREMKFIVSPFSRLESASATRVLAKARGIHSLVLVGLDESSAESRNQTLLETMVRSTKGKSLHSFLRHFEKI